MAPAKYAQFRGGQSGRSTTGHHPTIIEFGPGGGVKHLLNLDYETIPYEGDIIIDYKVAKRTADSEAALQKMAYTTHLDGLIFYWGRRLVSSDSLANGWR